MAMQFLNILWLVIYFGQEKIYIITTMDEEKKGSCFYLYFILFLDSHLLYVHITCSPLHTSFHSCSLYFVRSHIQTNKIAGENEGVLTAALEEEIQRYMLVLLFHIPLFCISFIVCICVHIFYCM